MINSVSGTITAKTADMVFLDTGGVEWAVQATRAAVEKLPEPGGQGRVYVYLHHRENLMQLYGFCDCTERDIFMELLKINGLGPRLALRVLSGMSVSDLSRAVEAQDVASLSRVPGLGKKTAERIVLALRGRIARMPGEAAEPHSMRGDLVEALENMGFDQRAASQAVRSAMEEVDGQELEGSRLEEEVLRLAIARIARP